MPRLYKVVDRPRVLALAAISRMPGASASRRLTAVGLAVTLPAVLLAVQGSAVPASDPQRPPEPPALVDDAKTPGPVPERSTEYSNTVRNDNGTYTTEVSAGPVNFEDESGNWLPISNELVPAPGKAYAVTNEANSFSVSIPEDPSKTPVKFEEAGAWVTMKMIGAGSSKPEVDGSEATFDNVPAADAVTYEATDTGVKETIVLDERPAAGPAYRYLLRVSPGITPVLMADQTVEFRDGAGKVKFLIPRGVMNDSAGPEPAYSDAVTYTLAETGSSWRFTVIPSASWLDDPARVYPVTIDPTVDKNTQKSCWLQEESAGSTHCGEWILKAGANENLKRRRALVDFNIGGIPPNAAISNATAWIWMDHYSTSGSGGATSWALYNPSQLWGSCASWAYTCHQGGTWTGGGSQGQISTNSVSLGGSSSGWQAWDITARVAGWLNGGLENRGVLLRQTGENVKKVLGFVSETHSNTGLRPLLRVTYTDNPPTVGNPVLHPVTADGTTTHATPTVGAVVTDPENANVGACFWVYDITWTTLEWSGCKTTGQSGTEIQVAVPEGELVTGSQYQVLVYGADGMNWSSNSTTRQFSVDSARFDWKGNELRNSYAQGSPYAANADARLIGSFLEEPSDPVSGESGDLTQEELPDESPTADTSWTPTLRPVSEEPLRGDEVAEGVAKSSCTVGFTGTSHVPGSGFNDGSDGTLAYSNITNEYLTRRYMSGNQAESVVSGNPLYEQTKQSPKSKADYTFGFTWPASAPSDVVAKAHLWPVWRGQFALAVVPKPGDSSSEASAKFYSGAGWYDATVGSYENKKAFANIYRERTTFGLKKYFFENLEGTERTVGVSLVPGRKYVFYTYSYTRTKVVGKPGRKAGAASDFGSRNLDTIASQQKIDGTSVEGYSLPGTQPLANTFKLVFRSPSRRVSCP